MCVTGQNIFDQAVLHKSKRLTKVAYYSLKYQWGCLAPRDMFVRWYPTQRSVRHVSTKGAWGTSDWLWARHCVWLPEYERNRPKTYINISLRFINDSPPWICWTGWIGHQKWRYRPSSCSHSNINRPKLRHGFWSGNKHQKPWDSS